MTRPRIYELEKSLVSRKKDMYGSPTLNPQRNAIAVVHSIATPAALCPARASVHERLPTAWERKACTPDALHLYRRHILREDAVAACPNSTSLSEQCRHVISV